MSAGKIIGAFILLTLAACSPATGSVAVPTLMELSTATNTAIPTVTPTPTPPLPPTWTPTATDTPTPPETATPECDEAGWWANARPVTRQFLDVAEIAAKTPRVSLAPMVVQLREIERQAEDVTVPDCIKNVGQTLISAMGFAVDGLNEFLGNNDIGASVDFDLANQYFYDVHQWLRARELELDYRMFNTAIFVWGGSEPNTDVTPSGI